MEIIRKVRESYEQIAQAFDKSREEPWIEVVTLPVKYASRPYRIVDIGCGCGANAMYVIQNVKYLQYIAIDIAENMLRRLRERVRQEVTERELRVDYICADIRALPLRSNVADVIYCIATLHHVPERSQRILALREIVRCAKSDSLILVTVWLLSAVRRLRKIVKLTEQDVLVPWSWKLSTCVYRFYHLYRDHELLDEVQESVKGHYRCFILCHFKYVRGSFENSVVLLTKI
jgi:ubiquinone/menaquinone biosynthesis C-methylase UbiE